MCFANWRYTGPSVFCRCQGQVRAGLAAGVASPAAVTSPAGLATCSVAVMPLSRSKPRVASVIAFCLVVASSTGLARLNSARMCATASCLCSPGCSLYASRSSCRYIFRMRAACKKKSKPGPFIYTLYARFWRVTMPQHARMYGNSAAARPVGELGATWVDGGCAQEVCCSG